MQIDAPVITPSNLSKLVKGKRAVSVCFVKRIGFKRNIIVCFFSN